MNSLSFPEAWSYSFLISSFPNNLRILPWSIIEKLHDPVSCPLVLHDVCHAVLLERRTNQYVTFGIVRHPYVIFHMEWLWNQSGTDMDIFAVMSVWRRQLRRKSCTIQDFFSGWPDLCTYHSTDETPLFVMSKCRRNYGIEFICQSSWYSWSSC